ncbi:hypothetical protein Hanom_Chr10g00948661 [Helianthus anomalus]
MLRFSPTVIAVRTVRIGFPLYKFTPRALDPFPSTTYVLPLCLSLL